MNSEMMTDGFHLVVDALKLNALDTIYGVAGIPITDLARLAQAEGLRYFGFRHEQSAGNAAAIAGYLTQKPGICLTVSAPGFLNGLVALANATTNCFPMILISGSSNRAIVDLEQGDYEELDQMNAAKPFAKAAFRVNRVEDIGIGIARAIHAALSGRPGGVYLDLTAAALSATLDLDSARRSLVKVVDPAPRQIPAPDAVARAIDLLAHAKHPLIILGKGAAYAQAEAEIRQLIETTGIPFLPMSMAKGLLPDSHPQSAATARSLAIGQADVVVLIGARLNWLLSHGKPPLWSETTQFVQLDISPTEIDSNRPIAAPVVGDIKSAVAALLGAIQPGQVKAPADWLDVLEVHKKKNVERMAARLAAEPSPMNFSSALRAVRDVLADRPDVTIVNEGANTLDFARNIIDMTVPRKRLDSGTWGVMGIGMGYAIAAAAVSGKPVVAIEGDSAFGFSGMEIETICRYKLPIVTIVLNNGGIYHGDKPGERPSPTGFVQNARYDKMIEAFGGGGYHVTDTAGLGEALSEALASCTPALINCVIDPTAGTESGHIQNLNPKSALKT
ncbi:oxalyl-CoA decarboxylase [Acidisoma silvae]|uniref:Oxalyl-CoA decarboxylase n=1 Tax=Acidisoma silvae TaxID=2802396 RepID=A0A963YUL5_9PROT|nr:oxalyl-CoA decarboxylase [Acidisoma silvae]MCB8877387.1 oxalyl-CoA decarboxylase [Acidisoma silvae]